MPGLLMPASDPTDRRLLPQRHAAGPPGHRHLWPKAGGGGAQPRRPAGRPAGWPGRGRQRVQEQVGAACFGFSPRLVPPGKLWLYCCCSAHPWAPPRHARELLMLCCLRRYSLPPAPQGAAHQHLPGHAVRQAGDQRGQGQRPQVRAVPRRAPLRSAWLPGARWHLEGRVRCRCSSAASSPFHISRPLPSYTS